LGGGIQRGTRPIIKQGEVWVEPSNKVTSVEEEWAPETMSKLRQSRKC
jgi:hypothetical protein